MVCWARSTFTIYSFGTVPRANTLSCQNVEDLIWWAISRDAWWNIVEESWWAWKALSFAEIKIIGNKARNTFRTIPKRFSFRTDTKSIDILVFPTRAGCRTNLLASLSFLTKVTICWTVHTLLSLGIIKSVTALAIGAYTVN